MFTWLKKRIAMKYVSSIIRHLLSLLAGILVTRGIVSPEVAGSFVSSSADVLLAIASYAIAQYWSLKDKK